MFLLWQSTNVWEKKREARLFYFRPTPSDSSFLWSVPRMRPSTGRFIWATFVYFCLAKTLRSDSRLFISLSVHLQLISSSVNFFVSPIPGLSFNQNPLKSFCCCSHCFAALIHFITSSCKGIVQPKWRFCHCGLIWLQTCITLSSVEHKKRIVLAALFHDNSQHGDETF